MTLTDALRAVFAELKPNVVGNSLNTGFGIRFELAADGTARMEIDQTRFSRALDKRSDDLVEFLLGRAGDGGSEGLIAQLSKALEQIEESVLPLMDPEGKGGAFLNTSA